MKTTLTLTLAVLMLAACSQPPPAPPKPSDIDLLAGVWRLETGELMIAAPSMEDFGLNIGGTDIPMRPVDDMSPHDMIVSAGIDAPEMGSVMTFNVIGDALLMTLHEGTQVKGQRVRDLTSDDLYALDKARHPSERP
jgi:hypothetical protein